MLLKVVHKKVVHKKVVHIQTLQNVKFIKIVYFKKET